MNKTMHIKVEQPQYDLLLYCGMIEKKLCQKLAPLQASASVRNIYLVRREPFTGKKIISYHPPSLLRRSILTAEAWRVLTTIYLCLFKHFDAVICMTLIPHGLHALLAATIKRIPLISHIMGQWEVNPPTRNGGLLAKIRLEIVKRSAILLVRGSNTLDLLVNRNLASADHIFVQHNVFDFSGYHPNTSATKKYDMVFVGNLEPNKHLDLLLQIVSRLSKTMPHLSLALIGSGCEEKRLRALGIELNIQKNLLFLGSMGETELIKHLQYSKVFVLTSLAEGMPQVVIEAMACGLPPVVFNSGDTAEIVINNHNGILVPPNDLDEFARAVEQLLTDDTYYKRISTAAGEIHEERSQSFSLEEQCRLWDKVLYCAVTQQGPDSSMES
jgi:glycosyltransferase involved in cell wall biosynthesis